MEIAFFKPGFDQNEFSAIEEFFKKNLSNSEATKFFAENIKFLLKSPYCYLFKSGTLALYTILLCLELKDKEEVIVSNIVCEGVINAIVQARGTPVLIDVEPTNANINVECIKKAINDRTKAIIAVHYGGVPCDIRAIQEICKENNIILIEDAAQALGAHYLGELCGSLGDISILSFYANKIITSTEGGAVICKSEFWAKKISSICYTRDELLSESLNFPQTSSIKFEFLMDELSAVIGQVQLSKLYSLIEKRKRIFKLYNESFRHFPNITIPETISNHISQSYYQYILKLKENTIPLIEIIEKLKEYGIRAYPDFVPVNQKLKYSYNYQFNTASYPISEKLSKTRLSLPCYPELNEKQIIYIIKSLETIFLV